MNFFGFTIIFLIFLNLCNPLGCLVLWDRSSGAVEPRLPLPLVEVGVWTEAPMIVGGGGGWPYRGPAYLPAMWLGEGNLVSSGYREKRNIIHASRWLCVAGFSCPEF